MCQDASPATVTETKGQYQGGLTRACSSRGPQRFGRREISLSHLVRGGLSRASLLKPKPL